MTLQTPLAFFLTGPSLESSFRSPRVVVAEPGLWGLFNEWTVDGTAVRFSSGPGDVGGLLPRELRGDEVKKLGGLELCTGEDGRGSEGTGTSSEYSIE